MKYLKLFILILLLVLVGAFGGRAGAADFYVQSTVGDDGNPGDDWGAGRSLATVARGIELAEASAGSDTIHIAAGTYQESLVLSRDLTLWGGYPAEGGTDRDPLANVTIINGADSSRPLLVQGAGNVTIDGLTIENGYAEGRGGGIYIEDCSGVVITNNVIRNNESTGDWGGGAAVVNSNVLISSNTISGNRTDSAGGGLSFWNNCTGSISDNTISDNTAYDGGGVIIGSSLLTIDGNYISQNTASDEGGGVYCDSAGNTTISNNSFSGNLAYSTGGGLNDAYGTMQVSHNAFYGNESRGWGGGIAAYESQSAFFDNLLANNEATEVGGGMSLYYNSNVTVINHTYYDNNAGEDGGGLYCHENSLATVRNSIFWANTPSQIFDHSGLGVTVNNSDVQGGYAGTDNLDEDPLFVGGYYLSQTASGQLNQSPAVDAGDDTAVSLGLDARTTRTDGGADSGVADLGHHFLSGAQYTVTFTAGGNGNLEGETLQTVPQGGSCTPVTAIPDANYHFSGWTGDYAGSENPLILGNVVSDMEVTANFEAGPAPTYTVNFQAGANGSLQGDASQSVEYGQDCTPVTAVPDQGYEFSGWSGDFSGAENPLTLVNVVADMTITANFEPLEHTVTFAAGPNGSLIGTAIQSVLTGEASSPVEASPDPGYHFAGWTGDYVGNENPLTIDNVYTDMTITANFEEDAAEYTVTFTADANGSIQGQASQTVAAGENTAAVTAVPAEGYHFNGWTGDYVGNENPLTITDVNSDMDITANFAINTYTVTFVPGANGGLTGATSQTVFHGFDATPVTAVPNAGYHFIDWSGDYAGTENPLTLTNVTSDMTVTANFEINTYTVTFLAGADGGLTGQTIQTVEHGDDCAPVTAVPDDGRHFTGWTGDYTGTENPLTLNNVTSDMTVTANFEINTYTVTFLAGANGSLTGQTVQTIAHGGDCSAVTAVPDNGYHFSGWTGDHIGEENPLTIANVVSDMTVTAGFEAGNMYTVVFIAGPNGGLTGQANQSVLEGEDCTPVTAVPDADYRFMGWTGDYEGSDNPLTIANVAADMTITANFSSYHTVITPAGQTVGAAIQSGGEITSFTSVDPDSIPSDAPGTRPADEDMPHGLLGININVDAPGGQAVVVIVLPEPAPEGFGWVKYIQGQGWFDFSSSAEYNADRTVVRLTLVDGGPGDADGAADGVIVDPSGPYKPASPFIPLPVGGGGDSKGGCFINSIR